MELLVVQLDPPHTSRTGDWTYRSDSPCRALGALPGVSVVNLDLFHPRRDELARAADVLVLTMACDLDLLPIVLERKQQGRPTVYEINDDPNAVQTWNTAYGFYRERENVLLLMRLASLADALQFSVPELARLYGHLNPRRAVFPNQLWDVPALAPRAARDAFVVGWGGSHGHLEDVRRIAPALIRFIETHEHAELRIMGASTIAALFESLGSRMQHVPPGPIEAYYDFVRNLDVGVAPIDDTAFNRCRSDVKQLEYQSRGAVAVVQRCAVYASLREGETGLGFDTLDDLERALHALYEDRDRLTRLRAAAHAYAETRSEAAHAPERLALYTSLTSHRSGSQPGHVELGGTRFQALLHDALTRRSTTPLDEARSLEPMSELPDLLEGAMRGDAASYERALALKPSSLRAQMGLATAKARAGDLSAALGHLIALSERYVGWEAPFYRAATLLEGAGYADDATSFRAHADALSAPLLSG